VDRRTFLVTSLASGFALAVSPAGAQTITTDQTGLTAGDIKIGQMPAYRAMPDTKDKKFPLVLVVQEIFGVHEHIKDLCRRLAKVGYLAIAPELFARQGDVSKMTDINEIITKVVMKVPDEDVTRDLDATVDWARAQGKLDGDRVAITGFCWGGRVVWLYGASPRAPKAGAAWYGRLSHATNALQTKTPIDLAPKIKTPIIGFYGGKDSGIPLGHVDMMKRELQAAGSKSEITVYPNAGHAFNADYRPSYDAAAAKEAWSKMLDWFKKNGV
jgi:carboxymethylenebutenolidase